MPNSAGVNLERPGGASPTFEPRLGGSESTDVYIVAEFMWVYLDV